MQQSAGTQPDWFGETGLYPILDRDVCQKRGLEPAAVLDAWRRDDRRRHIRYYQWRAKGLGEADYLASAAELRSVAPDLALIANDCLAALESPVFSGLHLGQSDLAELTAEEAAALAAVGRERPEFVRGLSTHSAQQITRFSQDPARLRQSWSYLALGPCFATSSKPTGTDPVLSAAEFQSAVATLANRPGDAVRQSFPLVLIGGIQAANLGALVRPVDSIVRAGRVRLVVAGISTFLDPAEFSDLATEFERECG